MSLGAVKKRRPETVYRAMHLRFESRYAAGLPVFSQLQRILHKSCALRRSSRIADRYSQNAQLTLFASLFLLIPLVPSNARMPVHASMHRHSGA